MSLRAPLGSACGLLLPLLFFGDAACTGPEPRPTAASVAGHPPGQGLARPGTPNQENIALARGSGRRARFRWEPWSKEVFERARRERRFILLDGAAEWCHWCHVMDETTYADPEVGKLLQERFVAIRVDVDERPDIASRYEDWGWPATVLFTPDAEELGKYRGYLPPEQLQQILKDTLKQQGGAQKGAEARHWPREAPPPLPALWWVGARVARDLDRRYDEEQGGWGGPQKAPLSANVEFELLRRARGDLAAGERAAFTLKQQRPLIDPVWGGMYQYSVGGVWTDPHFEKLMPIQAAAIEAYARAAAVLGEPAFLKDARAIAGYLDRFLSSPQGAFFVSQDADVGAHDRKARFVDGHVYYAKDDAGRRALGIPRVDDHVYARENGLAIAALCALYEASKDEAALQRAERAAMLLFSTHIRPDGTVLREAGGSGAVRYLIDAAAMARAVGRLAEVTRKPVYREVSLRIARNLLRTFADPRSGLLYVSTPDPAAGGVFAQRRQPFAHNVSAARALLTVARVSGDASLKARAIKVLSGLSTPEAIDNEGRMIGEFLLALAEAGVLTK